MGPERERGISGPRFILEADDPLFPQALREVHDAPERLYAIGDVAALQEGLAIVGARKATPYGLGCARRFAMRAAEKGIAVISGGARGCDAEAHRAALEAGGKTVVFLGGGADVIYPREHASLFQRIVDGGGALVSEREWAVPPLPYMFRARNRLIAALARATLIVEAGLPSGTFSTADEALGANRDVLVVPGSIDSPQSRGANRLICQGAAPIVDDDSFDDALFSLFGIFKQQDMREREQVEISAFDRTLIEALAASPMGVEAINRLAAQEAGGPWGPAQTNAWVARMAAKGIAVRHPGGRWGIKVKERDAW